MLLGRKLLKKLATRYEAESGRSGAWKPWVSSRRRQRHVATASIA
jgi:hypothetical protein